MYWIAILFENVEYGSFSHVVEVEGETKEAARKTAEQGGVYAVLYLYGPFPTKPVDVADDDIYMAE